MIPDAAAPAAAATEAFSILGLIFVFCFSSVIGNFLLLFKKFPDDDSLAAAPVAAAASAAPSNLGFFSCSSSVIGCFLLPFETSGDEAPAAAVAVAAMAASSNLGLILFCIFRLSTFFPSYNASAASL